MQIVFQNPYASLNPRFSVGQTLTERCASTRSARTKRSGASSAAGLLEKVGLPREALFKYPHEFSGGQRQRIAIARALSAAARAPDPATRRCRARRVGPGAAIEPAADLQDEYRMSYLFISHDLAVVEVDGRRGDGDEGRRGRGAGAPREIYADPEHPYTKRFSLRSADETACSAWIRSRQLLAAPRLFAVRRHQVPGGLRALRVGQSRAPKGGDLELVPPLRITNFDKFNPFTLKGTAPPGLGALVFEALLTGTMDEPTTPTAARRGHRRGRGQDCR
jgi:ABC-type microcin C transport system duplicated ATPase subunit YejF